MTTAVGIDVGKAPLDLAIDGVTGVVRFTNNASGIRKLVARLGRLNEPRIVVEATGGYEDTLLEACCDAGLWICRVGSEADVHRCGWRCTWPPCRRCDGIR